MPLNGVVYLIFIFEWNEYEIPWQRVVSLYDPTPSLKRVSAPLTMWDAREA